MMSNLQRFIDAQQANYQTALSEVRSGRKRSHWIWYIFPQLKGLGYSHNSAFYGISDLKEAEAYLQHRILGPRIKEICKALLALQNQDPSKVMGYPDDLKLKSSMTLFTQVQDADPVFQQVLDQYFHGNADQQTLHLLGKSLSAH